MSEERRSVLQEAASGAAKVDANIRDNMSAVANNPRPIMNIYSGMSLLLGVEQAVEGRFVHAAAALAGSIVLRKMGQFMEANAQRQSLDNHPGQQG